ncbi:MAG: hypothetical protein V7641_866 [Blastocatellia bacterium]
MRYIKPAILGMCARAAGAEFGKASTPIESGTIDVQAIVTLTVEIAQ